MRSYSPIRSYSPLLTAVPPSRRLVNLLESGAGRSSDEETGTHGESSTDGQDHDGRDSSHGYSSSRRRPLRWRGTSYEEISDSEQVTRQWSDSEDGYLHKFTSASYNVCTQKHIWLALALCALAACVVLTVVLPAVTQQIVDETAVRLVSLKLSRPRRETIFMNVTVEVHDVRHVDVHLHTAALELYFGKQKMAQLYMPPLDIKGLGVAQVQVCTDVFVANSWVFANAMEHLAQGNSAWQVRGNVQLEARLLGGWKKTFDIVLEKQIFIPGSLLYNAEITSMDVLQHTHMRDSIKLTSDTLFYSSSPVELEGFGNLVFDIRAPSKGLNLEADELARIGQVYFEEFTLRQGSNEYTPRVKLFRTEENKDALGAFLSRYLQDEDQVVLLQGPLNPMSPFLNNTLRQVLRITGCGDHRASEVSLLDQQLALEGFRPSLNSSVVLRGPLTIAHNPLSAAVTHRNITSQIYLEEAISFILDHPGLGHHQCNLTDQVAELYSTPGMYKDHPEWPPEVSFAAKGRRSVFLPARPLPGQSIGPKCTYAGEPVANGADCCFAALNIAAACRAQALGAQFFNTKFYTSYQLYIGDFGVPVTLAQASFAVAFNPDVSAGFALGANLSCTDIVIL